jgi:Ca2+-binding EF-hand superfamily protein
MKNYSFAYFDDEKNEAIDTKPFNNLLEAIEFFAAVKNLPADEFLKVYKVFDKK